MCIVAYLFRSEFYQGAFIALKETKCQKCENISLNKDKSLNFMLRRYIILSTVMNNMYYLVPK